jgi:hypothetical protein
MASSSNRRRLNTYSESTPSLLVSSTFDEDVAANLRLYILLEFLADNNTNANTNANTSASFGGPGSNDTRLQDSDYELNRMLSLHREVSTTSSTARHDAVQERDEESFKKIGARACGAIFAQNGRSLVVKLAKSHEEDLWND